MQFSDHKLLRDETLNIMIAGGDTVRPLRGVTLVNRVVTVYTDCCNADVCGLHALSAC